MTTSTNALFMCDINKIHIREGHNPRKFRNSTSFKSMKEDIAQQGVHTPIVVRPHPTLAGEYEIAAGETRFLISKELQLETIPVIERDMCDAEMLSVAISENTQRREMNAIDEAHAAQAALIKLNDESEALRVLGWTKDKFKRRLLLTYAIDAVRDALEEETIRLGHAELLSGIRKEAQAGALKFIIDNKLSVEQMRERIEQKAQRLDVAIFDQTDCATCEHNSSYRGQQGLFEGAVTEGRCLNSECFNNKTEHQLESKKQVLSETYGLVKRSSEVGEGNWEIIARDGAKGVGVEQEKQCISCDRYGALLHDSAAMRGRFVEGTCFDKSCHQEKITSHAASLTAPKVNDPVAQEMDDVVSTREEKKKTKASPKGISVAIKAKNHAVHRESAASVMLQSNAMIKAWSIVAMIYDGNLKAEALEEVGVTMSMTMHSRVELFKALSSESIERLEEIMAHCVKHIMTSSTSSFHNEKTPENDTFGEICVALCREKSIPLEQHFVMDKGYLKLHTVAVIHQILADSKFTEYYSASKGEKATKELFKLKKDDLLDAVFEVDFDWSGYVPESMQLGEKV